MCPLLGACWLAIPRLDEEGKADLLVCKDHSISEGHGVALLSPERFASAAN